MFDEAKAMRSRMRLVDANEPVVPAPELTLWQEGKPNPAMVLPWLVGLAFWGGLAWWAWG